jgi:hypothetical protein
MQITQALPDSCIEGQDIGFGALPCGYMSVYLDSGAATTPFHPG